MNWIRTALIDNLYIDEHQNCSDDCSKKDAENRAIENTVKDITQAFKDHGWTPPRKTISHEEAMDFVEREILSKQYQPKTVRISRTELMNDPVYCLTEVRVDNERENK